MGMFDYLRCEVALPSRFATPDMVFQTKDGDCLMDTLHIKQDGYLWGEEYDIEDHSDPNATGLARLIGCMTRTNVRQVRTTYTGMMCFYADFGQRNKNGWGDGFLRFEAQFEQGRLLSVKCVEETLPDRILAEENAELLQGQTAPSAAPLPLRRV